MMSSALEQEEEESMMMMMTMSMQLIPPPQSPASASERMKMMKKKQVMMSSSCRKMSSRTCSSTTATTTRNDDNNDEHHHRHHRHRYHQNNANQAMEITEISDVVFFDGNCSAGSGGIGGDDDAKNDVVDDDQSFLSNLSEFSWGTTTKEETTATNMEIEEEEASPTTSTTDHVVDDIDDDDDSWGSCAIPVNALSTVEDPPLSVQVEGDNDGDDDDDDLSSYFSAKQESQRQTQSQQACCVDIPAIVTMEQLVEETKTLSMEENESIIKDLYGKNNHHQSSTTQGAQPTDDISSSLIDDFYLEVEKILANNDTTNTDQKRAYGMALMKCPTIVEEESSPILFLRRENNNPQLAAQRMLLYWRLRVEVFGPDRAFLPMTLDGALADDVDTIVKYPNLFKVLPNCDKQGRTVICFDKTNFDHRDLPTIKFVRYLWGVIHQAILLKKKSNGQAQQHIVMVSIIPSFTIWEHDSKLPKLMGDSLEKTIPIKLVAQHLFVNYGFETSFFASIVLPVILFIMGKICRTRCQFYSLSSTESEANIERLEQFGLMRSGLPKSIPGCG